MNRTRRRALSLLAAGAVSVLVGGLLVGPGAVAASAKAKAGPTVLYVGTFHGVATPASSTYSSIQAAVDAATKGDWILIAPGDYHETGDMGSHTPTAAQVTEGWYGGVDVTTSDLHLRGMQRDAVVVDGTKVGASMCSSNPADQNSLGGKGRNGILVWKAKGVSVDNLTVCNFINGTGNGGNEIWWNGGDGSGKVGLKGYSGSYLTATSTYFDNDDPSDPSACSTCALYGIFSSNSSGGSWTQVYANNFSDSGMYVGACHRVCNVTISNAWMEDNALGYSGTNSGGKVVIEDSTFDNNREGVDTNTALTGDPPPPQDGLCPGKAINPLTHTDSCWTFVDNTVDDNNNANVPVEGTAGLGPTGTGMTVSGGRDDTVENNRFSGNEAWGILFVPYPDGSLVSDRKTCQRTGGVVATSLGIKPVACLFDPEGDSLKNNEFSGNGTLGNPSNADYGNLLAGGHEPENCFSGNTEWTAGFGAETGPAVGADPSLSPTSCGAKTPKAALLGINTDGELLAQAECDAGLLVSCSGADYPQPTSVTMEPVPALPTMPNPCVGVPANLWCPGGEPAH